jgi:hypothetical protein
VGAASCRDIRVFEGRGVARTTLKKVLTMLTLEELKKDTDLINEVEWDMTPEEAVKQYLEWGNTDWGSGKYVIRSKSDYTTYFVVNCWRKPYFIYLIRRNSEEALELAKFELPGQFEKDVCELKGVYALEDDVKAWLKQELEI